ncbi:pentapeptide repeat-containing protein [Streptomyces chilikensis]|uniref:WD40 domain-containing protein n=1 Tax=Streptomyces chilikensis TaxID=1194079 RepID=UPI001F0F31E3|nr:pentapeptide repeat-containing protein [Streptomyces chilikensis]
MRDAGAPDPDLLVVSGDLTASGSPRECEQALTFLTGLRSQLNLPPAQVAVVPGAQDVSQAACRAYFLSCEADETAPQKPYWEKWRHFSQRIFDPLYQGLDVVFAPDQPWTLFPVPELRTVVAGFNSSMAWSHRPDEQYGQVGRDQAAWFSTTLRDYERRGWFRLGVIRHPLTRPEGRGSERGPGRLRDADDFLRLAAPRLNMLLHGPSGPPRSPRTTPGYGTSADGLPLLGASAPGAFQLLEITREGVRRWHDVRETEPARFTPGWHRVDGVFGTPEPEPDEEERAAPAPADTFATRVLEICRVRRPGARFREITNVRPDDLTQYMATWEEDGVVRQSRVAVHPGTPALPEIARFAEQILQAGHDTAECVLVHAGDAPPPEVAERAPRFLRIRSFIEFQGLIDLRAYVRDQQAHLAGHASYPPGLYLRQRYREITRGEGEIHEDLLTDLLDALDSDQGRFLLLLGDFGHGKTFALRELARRMPEHSPHLVPVLVPLNTFDRAHSLLGLVTAHLAGHGVTRIDTRALRYMIREGRIVLLFDGFDELVNRVSYERAADHLEVLLSAAEHKAKIVVTSRTQHFKSDEQVFTALGERLGVLPQRRLLDIVGFRPTQIREYLSRSYGDDARAGQRYRLLEAVPDLLDLCQNPRLLSFVARLGDQHLQAVAGAGRALSPAALYQEVFTSWLRFEEARAAGGPGAAPGLTLDDLWTAVTALAERLWESGRQVLRLAELTETAGNALEGLGLTHMTRPEQVHSIASGSLLIRTPDGQFQFIHHSVVEWLLARRAALDLAEDSDRLLRVRALSALTVEFFCDLVDLERCEAWLNRTLQEPDAHPVARLNAVKISERLRVPSGTNLRGARLAGENLSHRDFSGVDFTGADLRDATLVGTDLTGAVLTGACFVGARLEGAGLRDADLRGADLSRARLVRADLRGARLAGSRWNRAALVDPRLDDAQAAAPELSVAAVAPGMPVLLGFPPARVGVPFGFGDRQARLPEPVAYSLGGELFAIGTEDGGVLICGADDGQAVRTLQGHQGRVYAVKFAPGVLAGGGADGTVCLWDPVSGELRHRLDVHPDGVWPVTLDPTGHRAATGDPEGAVTVWDVRDGSVVHRLPGHTAPVYTAVFSPDGRFLLTGDNAAELRVWDLARGTCAGELPGHRGAVYRIAFGPDGSLFATADAAGAVRVWRTDGFRLLHEFTGHAGRVYTLSWHPGGTLLASGSTEGEVRLWDAGVGTAVRLLDLLPEAVYQVRFSEDGAFLAACDAGGSVRLWTVREGTRGPEVTEHPRRPDPHRGTAWAVAFRPAPRFPVRPDDGLPAPPGRPAAQLLSVGSDGGARVWDAEAGEGRHILRGHGRSITSVSFSSDGRHLAAAAKDGSVGVWEARTGRRLQYLVGQGDRLVSAVFAPGAGTLATPSNDGSVHLWSADTGEYLREFDAQTQHIWAAAFSPDGGRLATANDDDSVRVWSRATGALQAELVGHRGRVRSIAFHPAGRRVATGSDDGLVRLWDTATGALVEELRGHANRIYGVAFDAAGRLTSVSWDGRAVVWEDGQPLRTLEPGGRLWAVAAHPHRPLLATGGDDRVITLWDTATGSVAARLTGSTGRVLSLGFRPDGEELASGGEDGATRLWSVPGDAPPRARGLLLGLREGWAALTPAGRYKYEGEVDGQFWHVVGMTRFAPGELDPYLPEVRRMTLGEPL